MRLPTHRVSLGHPGPDNSASSAFRRAHPVKHEKHSFYARGVGVILSAAGLMLLLHTISVGIRAAETANWPHTSGIVYASSVVHHFGSLSGDGFLQPHVEFAYAAGGRHFSSQVTPGDLPLWSAEEAADFVAEHAPGAVVRVYYNPDDHADAVLLTGIQSSLWKLGVPAAAFFLMGLSILIRVIRS